MGRKKETDDKGPAKASEKEPWFDDPYDNTIPWGAPVISVEELAEEIDKAPPKSYFDDKLKDLIQKPKRKRRKKIEWDDLLKEDPEEELRKALTILKQNKKSQEETSSQGNRGEGSDGRVDGKSVELEDNFTTNTVSSEINKGKLTNKSIWFVKDDFVMETSKKDQKSYQQKESGKVEDSSKSQKNAKPLVSTSDSNSERKKKSKKGKDYIDNIDRISVLNKELQKIKSELDLLSRKVGKPRKKETLDSVREKDPDKLQTTNQSELKFAKEIEESFPIGGSNFNATKDNINRRKGLIKERSEKEPAEPTLDHKPEQKKDKSSMKKDKYADVSEKESPKAILLNSDTQIPIKKKKPISKSKANTKGNIKSNKNKKNKEKERKEIERFFKNLNEKYPLDGPHSNINDVHEESLFEEKDGKIFFPHSKGGTGNIPAGKFYGASDLPLDDDFIGNSEHLKQKSRDASISKFLNSTLNPGDSFVYSAEKKED